MEKRSVSKATYVLYHASADFFFHALQYSRDRNTSDIAQAFKSGQYSEVHRFDLPVNEVDEQLESIFMQTQNHDEAWKPDAPCRSTSVGDIVRVKDDYFIVASVGFYRMPIFGVEQRNFTVRRQRKLMGGPELPE